MFSEGAANDRLKFHWEDVVKEELEKPSILELIFLREQEWKDGVIYENSNRLEKFFLRVFKKGKIRRHIYSKFNFFETPNYTKAFKGYKQIAYRDKGEQVKLRKY